MGTACCTLHNCEAEVQSEFAVLVHLAALQEEVRHVCADVADTYVVAVVLVPQVIVLLRVVVVLQSC